LKKSWYISRYDHFRTLLVEARKGADITQTELAKKLRAPQSYVSKYERGERRLDVVEFLAIAESIGADPHALIDKVRAGTVKPPRGA